MSESLIKAKNDALRRFFRIVVVFLTWMMVSIFPDSPIGFYQTVIIASITAAYEYSILCIDAENGTRRVFSAIGLCGCVIYFILAFLGIGGLMVLEMSTKTFYFTDRVPFSDLVGKWSFLSMVYPMYGFPFLIVMEPFLSKTIKAVASSKKAETNDKQSA